MSEGPSPAPGSRRIWTIPNILSLIRLASIPLFVWLSVKGHFAAAFFFFVGAALTDALDGWIARRFNQRSRLGTYLDPAADKTMLVTTYVVYTMPSIGEYRLPFWLTFTIFLRDITIVMFAYLLYTRIHVKRFPPNVAGKVSTTVQIVALAATIGANMFLEPLVAPLLWTFHRAALVITLVSGFLYIRKWERVLDESV